MDALIPVAIVGGGIAYVATRGNSSSIAPGDTRYQSGRGGSTLGDIMNGVPGGGGGSYDPWLDDSGQSAFNQDGRLADPDARVKLDLLNVSLQKAYAGMSNAAKATAADKMNQALNLDPPLKGNEDWATVARVAGGAAGGAACNAIPGIGTAVTPLCAMAGSYLGVQLENWMSTNLGGLQSWISDNLGHVVDVIGDEISDWFHGLF